MRRLLVIVAVTYGMTAGDEYLPLVAVEHGSPEALAPVLLAVVLVGELVGTSLAGYSPFIAKQANFLLLGGVVVGPNTLLRWYVLHVLALPFVLVIFLAVHFWRIRKDGGISGPM